VALSTEARAAAWLARLEQFDVVGSTNDVVAGWLRDGTPEVCVAIADEQSAGRGRNGRSWTAPPGASVLASVGFRPSWLAPEHVWRLGAIVSLAMADAADETAGVRAGTVRLKWPNDLVVVTGRDRLAPGDDEAMPVRKLAGVLGETDGIGSADPRAVVGIGINAGWPRAAFPEELTGSMTSLADIAPDGTAIDRDALIEAFFARLEPLVDDLRSSGLFPAETWRDRQLTNGLPVQLDLPDGRSEPVIAVDVDADTGALLIRPTDGSSGIRSVLVGEIHHLRFGGVV
jgi:BirA family biotin operon repressor/biotin-[acetyl-CoA-carboxylase] ligase